jgi:mitochondrial fission protein ELM1
MITEAAHTGKPVCILEVETKEKFKRLWAELYSLGIARKLENKLERWEYKPLDNIAEITKSIKL